MMHRTAVPVVVLRKTTGKTALTGKSVRQLKEQEEAVPAGTVAEEVLSNVIENIKRKRSYCSK